MRDKCEEFNSGNGRRTIERVRDHFGWMRRTKLPDRFFWYGVTRRSHCGRFLPVNHCRVSAIGYQPIAATDVARQRCVDEAASGCL